MAAPRAKGLLTEETKTLPETLPVYVEPQEQSNGVILYHYDRHDFNDDDEDYGVAQSQWLGHPIVATAATLLAIDSSNRLVWKPSRDGGREEGR